MSKFYAIFFAWLLLWQNCLNPTIEAVRFGNMNSQLNGLSAAAGGDSGSDQFDQLITGMTGGDQGLLKTLKYFADMTLKQSAFSLDNAIRSMVKMAPKFKTHSQYVVSKLQSGHDGSNLPRMLKGFLQQTIGDASQADQLIALMNEQQSNPEQSSGQMIKFLTQKSSFVRDCVEKSPELKSFLQSSGHRRLQGFTYLYDYLLQTPEVQQRRPYSWEVISDDVRNYYLTHPWKYPDVKIKIMFIVSMVLLGLYVASMVVTQKSKSCAIRISTVVFRVLVVIYCWAFFAIMLGVTSTTYTDRGASFYLFGVLLNVFVAFFYAVIDASISLSAFYEQSNLVTGTAQTIVELSPEAQSCSRHIEMVPQQDIITTQVD
ncbi:hypothetical protein MIR68_007559 [Amoeboaphelidium protococcarum]|nr:hypothetical protein MIR68_007559 [Amoeboaphelidium protococcarum]